VRAELLPSSFPAVAAAFSIPPRSLSLRKPSALLVRFRPRSLLFSFHLLLTFCFFFFSLLSYFRRLRFGAHNLLSAFVKTGLCVGDDFLDARASFLLRFSAAPAILPNIHFMGLRRTSNVLTACFDERDSTSSCLSLLLSICLPFYASEGCPQLISWGLADFPASLPLIFYFSDRLRAPEVSSLLPHLLRLAVSFPVCLREQCLFRPLWLPLLPGVLPNNRCLRSFARPLLHRPTSFVFLPFARLTPYSVALLDASRVLSPIFFGPGSIPFPESGSVSLFFNSLSKLCFAISSEFCAQPCYPFLCFFQLAEVMFIFLTLLRASLFSFACDLAFTHVVFTSKPVLPFRALGFLLVLSPVLPLFIFVIPPLLFLGRSRCFSFHTLPFLSALARWPLRFFGCFISWRWR